MKPDELAKLSHNDQQRILHPASSIADIQANGPRIVDHAKGITVFDGDGSELLDGIAGLWCVNVGYGREEIVDAMAKASRELSYYHTFSGVSNGPQIRLAEKLMSLVPSSLGKVFFGNSGSDGNDTLMKIAWHYNHLRGKPEKRKFISRYQAYHGTSISTASLTGLASFHNNFGLPMDGIMHVDAPHYFRFGNRDESEEQFCRRLLTNIENTINEEGAETIAAFIAEPIMAAGGIIVPPKNYFEGLQSLLKKHDILFIVDEVVCGYGRLGHWFGCDYFNIQPDMMNTAKGLTSGYFPLSAAFITDAIWDVMHEAGGAFVHGYTTSGHPVGAECALANIAILERENLIENAHNNGKYLHQQLSEQLLTHPNVAEIRGAGLLAGIQLIADKEAKIFFEPTKKTAAKVTTACHQLGLIARPLPSTDSIALSPPLTINQQQIDTLVARLTQAINEVFAD